MPARPRRICRRMFTLIELIAVLVIVALLAGIAVVSYQRVVTTSTDRSAETTAALIVREAQVLHVLDPGAGWPAAMASAANDSAAGDTAPIAAAVVAAGYTAVPDATGTATPAAGEVVWSAYVDPDVPGSDGVDARILSSSGAVIHARTASDTSPVTTWTGAAAPTTTSTTAAPTTTTTAPFSPADLGPLVWLDASDGASITASAGAVTRWANKGAGGTSYDFTNANGGLQPTTGAVTQNGRNTISFDGNDWLANYTQANWTFLHDGTPFVIAIAARTTSAQGGYIGNTEGSFGHRGFYLHKNPNDGIWQVTQTGSGSTRPVENITANSIIGTGWRTITMTGDADAAVAADRSRIFVDAGPVRANNTMTAAPSASAPNSPMVLGALIGPGDTIQFPMVGQISEVIILRGADATEANRAALQTYLQSRWS